MSKISSVRYYQDNKERLQKRFMKDIKVFPKKKKKKINNMIVRDTKLSQKMKSKNWFSLENNVIK